MQEFYSKKLIELKPNLGKHYLKQICDELKILNKMQVVNAFKGKNADLGQVRKIYQKAVEIAKVNIQAAQEAEKLHTDLMLDAAQIG